MQSDLDLFYFVWAHELSHWIAARLGEGLGGNAERWLYPVFHVVLIWVPLGFAILLSMFLWRYLRIGLRAPAHFLYEARRPQQLPDGLFSFVLRYSGKEQIVLVIAGLVAMPVLYATLELPKIIINKVIGTGAGQMQFPMSHYGVELDQIQHLLILCLVYLFAVIISSAIKFAVNLYKGLIAERLLRHLRLFVFRKWRNDPTKRRSTEAIPLIAQEVEPIGGFAGDAFALPVFEGGTFLTIVIFMFLQNPILGLAALTLLPVQLLLVPWFQRRINNLARERVRELRRVSGNLGQQAASDVSSVSDVYTIAASFRTLEKIRWQLYKWKFAMKALNNFLTAITPFFFYAVGGYLVIENRLSLGALVAVLAAYKDFSNPLKQLFKYYQTKEDVAVRYHELRAYFGMHLIAAGTHSQASQEGLRASEPVLQST